MGLRPFLILCLVHPLLWSKGLIREIVVHREPIFRTDLPEESGWIYRTANRLHFLTKEKFIRHQLLFQEGDPLDPLLLEASERRLRDLGFFNPVRVESFPLPDGNFRVIVTTRDTWTTNVGGSFSFFGGATSTGLFVEETNFLGWGKTLSVGFAKEEEQNVFKLLYKDPSFRFSKIKFSSSLWRTTAGDGFSLLLTQPFYSRLQRDSFRLSLYKSVDRVLLYWGGEKALGLDANQKWILGEYRRRFWGYGDRVFRGGAGWYRLERKSHIGKTYEVAHPYRLDNPKHDVQAFMILEYERERYLRTQGFYAFYHDEDLLLGPFLRMGLGFNERRFTSLFIDARWGKGTQRVQWQNWGILSHFFRHTREDQSYYNLSSALGYHWTDNAITLGAFRWEGFTHPGDTEIMYLGSENGLVGGGFRAYAGHRRIQATLLHKVRLWQNVLALVDVGMAAFLEMGKVWGIEGERFSRSPWRKSLGVGLRIESLRSGFSVLTRIDVGYDPDRDAFSLVVTTGEWFDWRKNYLPTDTTSPSHAMWWLGRK